MATSVQLKACGGLAPYTWSSTGNVTLDRTTGVSVTVTGTGASAPNTWVGAQAACMDIILYSSRSTDGPPEVCFSGDNRQTVAVDRISGGAAVCTDCDGNTVTCPAAVLNNVQFQVTISNCTDGDRDTFTGGGTATNHDGSANPVPLAVTLEPGSGVPSTPITLLNTSDVAMGVTTTPVTVDIRSASMRTGGCPDCVGCDLTGVTVTVTDAVGTAVTQVF